MQTKTVRFTETVVSLAQKAVIGEPERAYRPGKYGYADWVILSIQGPNEHLGYHYRKLMDVLSEMPRVTKTLGLTAETLPHFSTVYAKKQAISMRRWRAIPDFTVELYDLGDVQAIDATGVDRIQASQHYAKRTDYTFEAVKTSLLADLRNKYDSRYTLLDETIAQHTDRLKGIDTESRRVGRCCGR